MSIESCLKSGREKRGPKPPHRSAIDPNHLLKLATNTHRILPYPSTGIEKELPHNMPTVMFVSSAVNAVDVPHFVHVIGRTSGTTRPDSLDLASNGAE
jgi:hypothetical protein